MSDTLATRPIDGPHAGQSVLLRAPEGGTDRALVLVHGRYATSEGMLPVVDALQAAEWLVAAPQAAGGTWYPHSFMAPLDGNEPHLSSALEFLDGIVSAVADLGIDEQRVVLLGFSQGACLSLEYAARSGRNLGGVIGLSGGLIGPPGTRFHYEGSRAGLRVFLGCSDVDPHIPVERVRETERLFSDLGAVVTARIYPGMGHTISVDEINRSRDLLGAIE